MISTSKLFALALGTASVLFLSACSSSDTPDEEVVKDAAQVAATDTTANKEAETPSDVAEDPHFLTRAIYLRGEMNDYGVQAPYRLRKFDENKYCTVAPLRSDWSPYRFKFADAKWTEGTNFGAAVPPGILREGSDRAELNPNSRFEELRYEPKEDGIYRFCIEYTGEIPYATVTRLEDGKLTTMDQIIKREIETEFSVGNEGLDPSDE